MSQYGFSALLVRQADVEADREAAAPPGSRGSPPPSRPARRPSRPRSPASAKSRAVSRARLVGRRLLGDARRAEDRDGGPVDLLRPSGSRRGTPPRSAPRRVLERLVAAPQEPAVELGAPSLTGGPAGRGPRPSRATSAAMRHERGDGDDAGEPARLGRVGAPAARAEHAPRAEDVAAVEEPDRGEVDQVEEEAGVRERAQQIGVDRDGRRRGSRRRRSRRRPGRRARRARSATDRSGMLRSATYAPRNGMKTGSCGLSPCRLASM